jgi:hypothetical protein
MGSNTWYEDFQMWNLEYHGFSEDEILDLLPVPDTEAAAKPEYDQEYDQQF